MARVFVDTNVLFPFVLMDTMLTLAEDGVHELLWSDALLGEWERVIVRKHARSPQAAADIARAIREHFPEGKIAESQYVRLVSSMPGMDPDDRRHMAADHEAVCDHAPRVLSGWSQPFEVRHRLARRRRHADFESQPVWDDNPVREWEHPIDSLHDIGLFIQGSVQSVLGVEGARDVSGGGSAAGRSPRPRPAPAATGSPSGRGRPRGRSPRSRR